MEYYSNLVASRIMAEAIVESFKIIKEPTSLLNMCCGDGIITTELFKIYNCGNMKKISLVDINFPPKEILQNNQIEFIQSNLFNDVPLYEYDCIYSSYPCFTEKEYYLLNQIKNTLYPKEAYCVPLGKTKFYFLQEIMSQGSIFLSKNGIMVLYCLNDDFVNYCKEYSKYYNLIFYDIIYKINPNKKALDQFVILQRGLQ